MHEAKQEDAVHRLIGRSLPTVYRKPSKLKPRRHVRSRVNVTNTHIKQIGVVVDSEQQISRGKRLDSVAKSHITIRETWKLVTFFVLNRLSFYRCALVCDHITVDIQLNRLYFHYNMVRGYHTFDKGSRYSGTTYDISVVPP